VFTTEGRGHSFGKSPHVSPSGRAFAATHILPTLDAGTAALVYFTLLVLLARQMDRSRTPSGISRVSRWTFLTQAVVDSVSFAGHITFAVLTEGKPSLSLVAPAFLACTLFVYEMVNTQDFGHHSLN
jgi:hypothetical protein